MYFSNFPVFTGFPAHGHLCNFHFSLIFSHTIQERLCVLAAECASALQTSSTAHSCNPPEALSQSEIVLSLRRICLTHHLQKWESYLTEIKNPRSQIPLTPGTMTRGSTPVILPYGRIPLKMITESPDRIGVTRSWSSVNDHRSCFQHSLRRQPSLSDSKYLLVSSTYFVLFTLTLLYVLYS